MNSVVTLTLHPLFSASLPVYIVQKQGTSLFPTIGFPRSPSQNKSLLSLYS